MGWDPLGTIQSVGNCWKLVPSCLLSRRFPVRGSLTFPPVGPGFVSSRSSERRLRRSLSSLPSAPSRGVAQHSSFILHFILDFILTIVFAIILCALSTFNSTRRHTQRGVLVLVPSVLNLKLPPLIGEKTVTSRFFPGREIFLLEVPAKFSMPPDPKSNI